MKKFTLIALALAAVSGAYAQKGVEDGSRYGQGEDSINVLRCMSIYTEYVKTENYKDAYEQGWKTVFQDAPLASVNTYTNGVKILRWMYKNTTDADLKAQYSQELQDVYTQRLKYLDKLNTYQKKPTPAGEILGARAHDYVSYNPKPSMLKAYELLREAVSESKGATVYYVLDDLMRISQQRYSNKPDNQEYREALMQDYLDCAAYIDEFAATQQDKENVLEQCAKTKENIDAYFVKSGAADCETLQGIYGPKIEENKTNLEYLNKVVKLMSIFECKSSDAYFAAAEYAHQISPSVSTAKSLGFLYLKQRDDVDKALEYYEQAVELDEDKEGKADTYQTMASIWLSKENYDKSRSCANKALSFNPNKGAAYILLAQLYAIKHNWNDEPSLNQCSYFAVLDKLEQAKRVDSSVAEKANELIRDYTKQCPKPEDLFMFSLKAGDKIEIKGWINETTTIR